MPRGITRKPIGEIKWNNYFLKGRKRRTKNKEGCFFWVYLGGCWFLVFGFFGHAAWISVPWPGSEPRPWQWKCQILTTRLIVPNIFGTRDRFRGRQFFHGLAGWGGMVQVVMRAMGKQQMKLRSLACRSPPTARPGS